MIKLVIFGVLGLALGLGGGSAMSVMKAKKTFAAWEAKKAKAVADSLAEAESHPVAKPAAEAHDSSGTDSTATDGHGETPKADTHAPADSHATPAPAPKKPAPKPAPQQVATVESHGSAKASGKPVVPVPPLPVPAANPVTQKMGKIFGAMPAKDAAKVMEQLDDAEVRAILTGLTDKQAAGVLQNLPAARAAAISKLLLKGAQ